MKTLTTIAASTLAMLMLATAAYSQSFLRADHKMSGNRMRSNQRHGRAQAQTLYHAAQAPRPVPRDDTRELVAAIRKDVEASNKALAKLEAEFGKVKEAVALFESIQKHHAKVTEDCELCEKSSAKTEGDNETLAENASEIYYELEEAEADTEKLLKVLKIDDLEAPKKASKKK
jgi:hypothetical protein